MPVDSDGPVDTGAVGVGTGHRLSPVGQGYAARAEARRERRRQRQDRTAAGHALTTGSRSVNRAPPDGAAATSIDPPSAAAHSLAMAETQPRALGVAGQTSTHP